MTKSDQIRRFAAEGLTVSEIAAKMGIRYQHAYNVLGKGAKVASLGQPSATGARKSALTVQTLLDGGFQRTSEWKLDDAGMLALTESLPKSIGVYAFAKNGLILYVGVATMGLAKRIYFYARPGSTQRTSQRLNHLIKGELRDGAKIELLIAQPENMEWNGLPVHGAAGLELGLIKTYDLPWNMRSAR